MSNGIISVAQMYENKWKKEYADRPLSFKNTTAATLLNITVTIPIKKL